MEIAILVCNIDIQAGTKSNPDAVKRQLYFETVRVKL
jgi:hypothetical protein